MKVPHLGYKKVINAFKRAGWEVVHQQGSHIKLRKGDKTVIVPVHTPLKRSTLSRILKEADFPLEDFLNYL